MDTIKFWVYGIPKQQNRPRARAVTPHGKKAFATVYADPASKKAEQDFRSTVVQHRPDTLLTMPLRLIIVFYFPVPPSYPKKRTADALEGRYRYTKHPDIDNLVKMVLDACNGILWRDDAQVCELEAMKCYSETPSTYVEVIPL